MTDHKLFYYPYASFTYAQLPLLKVAALYSDKLTLLDPVGASWDTVGADSIARDAVRQLEDAGILEIVTPATVLAQYAAPIAAAIRRDLSDRKFLDLCVAHASASGKQRWRLSLAKVPQDLCRPTRPCAVWWVTSRAKWRATQTSTKNAWAEIRASTASLPKQAERTTSTAKALASNVERE